MAETPLRRVTRHQYALTASAVLGVDASVSEGLVADEKVGAFYSNAIAPVTELGVEKYLDAAEALAAQAVKDLDALLPCDPSAIGEEPCARELIRELAGRAFRRPITADEEDHLIAVYAAAREDGPYAEGLEWAIAGVLSSPHFLYHVEQGTPATSDVAPEVMALTQHELAARVAYFLWSAPPDDLLRAAADAGELSDPAALEQHVRRMLADERAQETIASFHRQWLHIEELPTLSKDAATYPAFDSALGEAMVGETEAFAIYVIQQDDGRLETLLTAPYTFVTNELAALYGLPEPGHDGFEGVYFAEGAPRGGLLTQGAFLSSHSHETHSSPTFRGKVIRDNLLCDPPPPPPADVNDQLPDDDPDELKTLLEQRLTTAPCMSCHVLMDKIGLGLESYDAIGGFRTELGGETIEAIGEFVATDDLDGEFVGAIELANQLAGSDQVRACVATQWLRFSLGRSDGERDACSVETINERFAASDYDLRELVVAIALSDAMRYLRQPAEGEAQ